MLILHYKEQLAGGTAEDMNNSLKYMDIVRWTEEQIAAKLFRSGDRFLSEAGLGEKFGFSRQTVRRALQVLEERGYLVRVQGSGTYISQQPEEKKAPASMTVGIISSYPDDYIFPGIIRGIEEVMTANGYSLQLKFTKNLISGETDALRGMLDSDLDGLIVEPTKSGLPSMNIHLYNAILESGMPMVFMDSRHADVPAPCVSMDDEEAGYIATKHLYEMGHRKIAGLFAMNHHQGRMRYLGHITALRDMGLPVIDDRIFWYSKENLPEILGGRLLLRGLSECTAVVCYNDKLALRLPELLKQHDMRIPQDLSVVSIDNCELASVCSLTSVAHPRERLGEAAANLLLSIIGGGEGKDIVFPAKLVVRSSVKKLPGKGN